VQGSTCCVLRGGFGDRGFGLEVRLRDSVEFTRIDTMRVGEGV
jgi:hypothetical protein